MISTMLMVFIIVLLFPIVFMEEEERKAFLKKWRQAFGKMCVHFSRIIKKNLAEEREKEALRSAKNKFNDVFQKQWESDEDLRKTIYGWNIDKNEIYFYNPLAENEYYDLNRRLSNISKSIHQEHTYLLTGITIPEFKEGYGATLVANFIYQKKSELEEAERLAKITEVRNSQDIEWVESAL